MEEKDTLKLLLELYCERELESRNLYVRNQELQEECGKTKEAEEQARADYESLQNRLDTIKNHLKNCFDYDTYYCTYNSEPDSMDMKGHSNWFCTNSSHYLYNYVFTTQELKDMCAAKNEHLKANTE